MRRLHRLFFGMPQISRLEAVMMAVATAVLLIVAAIVLRW